MKFASLNEIKTDYNDLLNKVGRVTTLAELRHFLEKDKFTTIEINGIFAEDFIERGGTDSEIEWIRYETYGCLAYIYFHLDKNGIIETIMFDVWCDDIDDTFIIDTTIENLTEEFYEKCVEETKKYFK